MNKFFRFLKKLAQETFIFIVVVAAWISCMAGIVYFLGGIAHYFFGMEPPKNSNNPVFDCGFFVFMVGGVIVSGIGIVALFVKKLIENYRNA